MHSLPINMEWSSREQPSNQLTLTSHSHWNRLVPSNTINWSVLAINGAMVQCKCTPLPTKNNWIETRVCLGTLWTLGDVNALLLLHVKVREYRGTLAITNQIYLYDSTIKTQSSRQQQPTTVRTTVRAEQRGCTIHIDQASTSMRASANEDHHSFDG